MSNRNSLEKRIIGALIAIALVAALPAHASDANNAPLSMPPNNLGMVGWWTLDGKNMVSNVTDSSGQGNNGNLVGFTSTSSAEAPGVLGQALSFNGSNQDVTFSNPSALTVSSATSPISFSVWFKTTATNATIIALRDSTNSNSVFDVTVGYNGANNANTGDPSFIIRASNISNTFLTITGATPVNDGKWHLVTVTRTSGKRDALYIDGVSVAGATDTMTAGLTANVAGSALGRDPLNAGMAYFNGSLDDVRFYNRALSIIEVQRLYNLGTASHQNVSINPPNLASGLVGWWTFDGKDMVSNVADSSGQGNNGALVTGGAATSTMAVPGVLGQALKFNGSSQYVQSSVFNNPPSSAMTICAWINSLTPAGSSGGHMIVSLNRESPFNGEGLFDLYWANSAAVDLLFWDYDSGYGFNQSSYSQNLFGKLTVGVWHHACFVKNGLSGTYYLDAAFAGSVTAAKSVSYANRSVNVAGVGGTDSFNGSIDDVRIYSRALSASEITQLYNLGTASHQNVSINPPNLASGLVGWWTFDGKNMLSNVTDSSGQGNNGALVTGGAATSTMAVPGVLGQALSSTGNTQYVKFSSSPPASSLQLSTHTVSFWIYRTSTSGAVMFGSYDFTAGGFEWSTVNSCPASSGTVDFTYTDLSGTPRGWYNSSYTLPINTWIFLTLEWDSAAGKAYVYANGALQSTVSTVSGTVKYASGTQFEINNNVANPNCSMAAKYDDVRLYNRLLSTTEITQLYNLGH